MTTLMATYNPDGTGILLEKEPIKGGTVKASGGKNTNHTRKRSLLQSNGKPSHTLVDSESSEGEGAVISFSTNHNSVVCLPLVSEGLKLVWTHSDQTRELDGIPELVQAFNIFPYPTLQEVAFLARHCALPLDKVKVWFMVQRIKYGISWASEEIEETRCKLAVPEQIQLDRTEDEGQGNGRKETENGTSVIKETAVTVNQTKRPKYEPGEPIKPQGLPHFRSSLPPPQDSYYYRQPANTPVTSPETSVPAQRRHGRYKKTKAQLAVLRSSFLQENWPSEAELRRLQDETGLSRNDIRKWFSDSRYQLRHGRGAAGVAQVIASAQGEVEQLHPLPLVAHGPRRQQGIPRGTARGKGGRASKGRDGSFFQNFLSNSLEAVGEVGLANEPDGGEKEDTEKLEEDKEEEEEVDDEMPLQLVNNRRSAESLPLVTAPSSPSPCAASTASSSSATAALPHAADTFEPKSSPNAATPSPSDCSPSTSATLCSSPILTSAGRPRKTKQQLDVLKEHFLRCQWPKSEDYTRLVELTGLPRADVIQWYGDTRYAVKNGQLRWVRGVRDRFMAELSQQNGSSGSLRGGARRRKLEEKPETVGESITTGVDLRPLEAYRCHTGVLQEKDLDALCRKSRMSYQQVRDWFACHECKSDESELNATI